MRIAWAKSVYESNDSDIFEREPRWLPLFYHCADAYHTGLMLSRDLLAPRQRSIIASGLGKTKIDENEIDTLCAFVCAIHDIGKLTPAFAIQVPELAQRMNENGFGFAGIDSVSRRECPHSLAGEVILRRYFEQKLGWDSHPAKAIASLAGAHHGVPPTVDQVNTAEFRSDLIGEGLWVQAQDELLDWCVALTGADKYLARWARIGWSLPSLALLSGLVITADWIASNTDYFPLIAKDDYLSRTPEFFAQRARNAFRMRGGFSLPSAWVPRDPSQNVEYDSKDSRKKVGGGEILNDVGTSTVSVHTAASVSDAASLQLRREFALPDDAQARPMQKAIFQIASELHEPALILLEDTMGSGKTEAGLLGAHILAARSEVSGVWFTLPTQTTASAMFDRLLTWLAQIEKNEGNGSDFAVQLLHGRATLDEKVKQLKRAGYQLSKEPAGNIESYNAPQFSQVSCDVGRDEEQEDTKRNTKHKSRIAIHPWESGKKALLADFVVSTIDQLLMVALKSRHLALRHLGASRKVVIIDEVHASDVFMNVYLCKAIEWLAAYGISVIALSATLDNEGRAQLLEAYRKGREYLSGHVSHAKQKKGKWKQDTLAQVQSQLAANVTQGRDAPAALDETLGRDVRETLNYSPISLTSGNEPLSFYPAISVVTAGKIVAQRVEPSSTHAVKIRDLQQRNIGDFLEEQLGEGGCALVVRNTVRLAQETYRELKDIFGNDVVLMHARFVGAHRKANDQWLLDNFGKDAREGKRPKRAIVVATQVVEQSLDIDFDILVSDLCPVDVLLQRIGRLHRHSGRVRPKNLSSPICWVAQMPSADEAPQCDRGSIAVYGEKLLLASALAVGKYTDSNERVEIPGDIRKLMNEVYSEDGLIIPKDWEGAYRKAVDKFEEEHSKAKNNAQVFCLGSPVSDAFLGSSLDGWVEGKLGGAEDALIRAGVRQGQDSIEVILVNAESRENMATWSLLEGVADGIPQEIPTGRDPSSVHVQALMNSMVRLPASFTRSSRDIDATIEELGQWHPQWSEKTPLYGQLVLPIVHGEAELLGRTLRYSREYGLVEVKDER